MRILVTYGRERPYPPCGLHVVGALRAVGQQAALLCVRDHPWWVKATKRMIPLRRLMPWDPVAWANDRLIQAARCYRPDVILDIGGEIFLRTTLQELRRCNGTRLAAWLVEGTKDLQLAGLLQEYDLLTSTSRGAIRQLSQTGVRHVQYLPFATEPRWFHPPTLVTAHRPFRVGFVGAYSARRTQFLESVSDLGLQLWGTEWDGAPLGMLQQHLRSGKGVFGRALVRCYQQAVITLCIQREHMISVDPSGQPIGTGLSYRHFDVPACGSFLLTEWVEELPDALTIGEEVDTFTTPGEWREKVRFWLSHESAREAMPQRARARVLHEHTYQQRMRSWLQLVERVAGRPSYVSPT